MNLLSTIQRITKINFTMPNNIGIGKSISYDAAISVIHRSNVNYLISIAVREKLSRDRHQA